MKKACIAALAALFVTLPAHAADTFTLDNNHTFVTWEIWHLGISKIRGRFDKTSGKVTMDAAEKKGSIEVAIDTASVNTGVPKFDEHMKSEDIMDVAKFPEIKFHSGNLKFSSGRLTGVDGTLTIKGVSKPVFLTVDSFACTIHFRTKKEVCGVDAWAVIKRSDFGVNYGLGLTGDEVKLMIQAEGYKN